MQGVRVTACAAARAALEAAAAELDASGMREHAAALRARGEAANRGEWVAAAWRADEAMGAALRGGAWSAWRACADASDACQAAGVALLG